MEAVTRCLAIVSVSLGICVVTLAPVHAGLMDALRNEAYASLAVPLRFRDFSVFDTIQNILLFAPLGYLMAAGPEGGSRRGLWRAAVACFALSACVECAQSWIPGRYPSCWDVLFNTAGGLLGARMARLARRA
jgi:glycopeptide antibiotics resistance protein